MAHECTPQQFEICRREQEALREALRNLIGQKVECGKDQDTIKASVIRLEERSIARGEFYEEIRVLVKSNSEAIFAVSRQMAELSEAMKSKVDTKTVLTAVGALTLSAFGVLLSLASHLFKG